MSSLRDPVTLHVRLDASDPWLQRIQTTRRTVERGGWLPPCTFRNGLDACRFITCVKSLHEMVGGGSFSGEFAQESFEHAKAAGRLGVGYFLVEVRESEK